MCADIYQGALFFPSKGGLAKTIEQKYIKLLVDGTMLGTVSAQLYTLHTTAACIVHDSQDMILSIAVPRDDVPSAKHDQPAPVSYPRPQPCESSSGPPPPMSPPDAAHDMTSNYFRPAQLGRQIVESSAFITSGAARTTLQ